ncbi:glycosyltransferase family 2 protein [Streptomyces guryensis]|uniref:Glycosyltransferase n=1 Tax=Streptomyces guryensis TaxID=2886947 RepID=A0A9Q3VZK6_9ACTN|nr:glycosyltransferase [Streptomyces guryensis]MCD9880191.1 glycosyltransferase [Streptomyces guryensis]
MKISIVIPAYNSRQALELCLLTLAHMQLAPPHSYEVVIVDDGSDDGTAQMLASFPARFDMRWIALPRTAASSRSAARNAGVEQATGDVILMIDADQLITPGLVAEHVRYHELSPDLVVVGRRDELTAGPLDRDLLARRFTMQALPPVVAEDSREAVYAHFSANLNNLATCWHHLYSCNASVRREHLLAVGGFDESFRGWGLEDTELGYRLRRRGLAFAYNPAAVVYHQRAQTVTTRMFAEWRRNLRRFSDKHANAPEIVIQSVLGRPELAWEHCMQRFEYAARALVGRLPRPITYHLLEADDANATTMLDRLPSMAATTDLLVIDASTHAELSGAVQCIDAAHELLYFRQPTAGERARILARHQLTRQPGTVLVAE